MIFDRLSAALLVAAVSLQGATVNEPTVFVNRAEAVMTLVLSRTPDIPAIKNTNFFPDVPKGAWHEPFMLYAQKVGIVAFDPVTRELRPDQSVTRAEFLKMLTFTYGTPVGYPHRFSDVPADAWYAQYAGLASKYALFDLTSSTELEAQRAVTRDDLAKAVSFFERLHGETKEAPALEQDVAAKQAEGKLMLYTVISSRRQKVTLIDPVPKATTPLVRRLPLPQSLPEMRTRILTLVNAARTAQGSDPLTYSEQLEQSAQAYAERMTEEGFFTHVAPDGQTLKDRIAATGYHDRSFSTDCFCIKGYALGENLARGQKTPQEAFEAWMKSPSHREAIMNRDYTHIGIGARAGVWVQHFGGVLLPVK